MKKEFIRSKDCQSCGATIAAHLQSCPYCKNIQPAEDLLPEETYRKTEEKLRKMERHFNDLRWSSKKDFSYYLALLRMAAVPVFFGLIVYLIFRNLTAAIVSVLPLLIIAYIRKEPAYRVFSLGNRLEKKVLKNKFKPELDRMMEEYGAPSWAYEDIILDIVETDEYGEYSSLIVIMDPVDE